MSALIAQTIANNPLHFNRQSLSKLLRDTSLNLASHVPPLGHINRSYYLVRDLPYPATRLAITEHFRLSDDRSCFAWIIAGAFYDAHGRKLWAEEIFLAGPLPPLLPTGIVVYRSRDRTTVRGE